MYIQYRILKKHKHKENIGLFYKIILTFAL